MFQYTDGNYLEFGYNGERFNRRLSADDVLWARFGPAQREPLSFFEECKLAAKAVRDNFSGGLAVCLSGGLDSEITLRAFLETGIRVRAVSVRYEKGLNEHDLVFADRFCREHGIPHDDVRLDLESFWNTELFAYATSVYTSSPQFPVTMWLCDQISDVPVVGSGDSAIVRSEGTNDFYFLEREKYLALYLNFIFKKKPAVPAFLQYTPELLLSFFTHPVTAEYREVKARKLRILSNWKYKHEIYSHSFAGLESREVFNGFEYARETESVWRDKLRRDFPGAEQDLRFEFDSFVRAMRGEGAFADQSI